MPRGARTVLLAISAALALAGPAAADDRCGQDAGGFAEVCGVDNTVERGIEWLRCNELGAAHGQDRPPGELHPAAGLGDAGDRADADRGPGRMEPR